jgi:flagellar motor switch/type III secretory pathway protein FliN
MYRIGVVGPQLSVDRIIDVAKEFEQLMEFIPFPYQSFQNTPEIVLEHDHHVDVWLFSAQIPYKIARKTLGSDENLMHIQHSEASLYKCFLSMTCELGSYIDRVSIDEIVTTDLDEAIQQLDNIPSQVYVKLYDVETDLQELLQFHLDLWNEGKTDGAVTCFQFIYQSLRDAGVPAYWISPTRMEIRKTLRILAEKVRTFYFKDTQIGVVIMEIEQFDKIAQKAKSPYHLQYLELRLKETLLRLCEKLDGSLLEKGYGRYVIFSSRGAIERELTMVQNTVLQLSLESETTAAVGIGFGETVFSAEVNARQAIQYSKEKAERGMIIVQEDGTISESVGKEELTYSFRMDDKDFLEKLKKGNISVKTYNKIEALIRRMGWSDFTTKDLATHLYLDERNARRIVALLCEVELAECIGEESSSTRGRPSKIYRLV